MRSLWNDRTFGKRTGRATRSRRGRWGVEPLEERCVLSGLAGGGHPAQHVAAIVHALAQHARATHHVPARSAAAPAAASPLMVWWAFPTPNTTTGGDPGFLAVGLNQPINPATVNNADVQLAYQTPSGNWQVLASSVQVNPGNNAIVVTPLVPMPNGHYALAVYPGVQSTTGAGLAGPYFDSFNVDDTWGQPGGVVPTILFPSSNGASGVVIADQSRALDPTTVNGNTVKISHVNADGTTGAALTVGTDYTITYDPEIPSVEVVLASGLQAGNYRWVEQGVRDAAGNTMVVALTRDFNIPTTLTFPFPQGPSPIFVTSAFPQSNAVTETTPIVSVTFDRAANPATVNTSTVQLTEWLPAQGRFSAPLPATVTYNPATQNAFLVPTAGLAEGNYLIMVSAGTQKVTDQNGVPMSAPFFSHYTFYSVTDLPVDGSTFSPFPANGATVTGDPTAILVFLHKYAGDRASSINTSTVQLRPWLGTGFGNALPISVSYNPWPGAVVITPREALGDGPYVIFVNGVVDIAGNPQRTGFSSWFAVTGTGQPTTLS